MISPATATVFQGNNYRTNNKKFVNPVNNMTQDLRRNMQATASPSQHSNLFSGLN